MRDRGYTIGCDKFAEFVSFAYVFVMLRANQSLGSDVTALTRLGQTIFTSGNPNLLVNGMVGSQIRC
jgi:hypothetical protein